MARKFTITNRRYEVMCHGCGYIALENATLNDAEAFIASRGGHRIDVCHETIDQIDWNIINAKLPEEPCECDHDEVPNHRLIVDPLLAGWRVSC